MILKPDAAKVSYSFSAVMPHHARTEQRSVGPKCRGRKLDLAGGYQAAVLLDGLAYGGPEQIRASHDVTAQHDQFWRVQHDQIGKTDAEVDALALGGAQCIGVALACQFADRLRADLASRGQAARRRT